MQASMPPVSITQTRTPKLYKSAPRGRFQLLVTCVPSGPVQARRTTCQWPQALQSSQGTHRSEPVKPSNRRMFSASRLDKWTYACCQLRSLDENRTALASTLRVQCTQGLRAVSTLETLQLKREAGSVSLRSLSPRRSKMGKVPKGPLTSSWEAKGPNASTRSGCSCCQLHADSIAAQCKRPLHLWGNNQQTRPRSAQGQSQSIWRGFLPSPKCRDALPRRERLFATRLGSGWAMRTSWMALVLD